MTSRIYGMRMPPQVSIDRLALKGKERFESAYEYGTQASRWMNLPALVFSRRTWTAKHRGWATEDNKGRLG